MTEKTGYRSRRIFCAVLILALCMAAVPATCSCALAAEEEPIEIKVLILPKFETGELTGDAPGEAQSYYEAYCAGGEEYEIKGGFEGQKLHVRDGVALYVTGMGKVNAGASLQAILLDDRFDFSEAYVLGIGCAGSAYETTVMGDVIVVTAVVDFDLGHRVDIRDTTDGAGATWYHDPSYESSSFKLLDPELMDKVYELVKDVEIDTTEKTRAFMAHAFDDAPWAVRDPQVLRGTSITSDSYWKGSYMHEDALLATAAYDCPDPFLASEMEDTALATVMDRMGMLDRLIILRNSVNMDVFMNGATPESLWSPETFQPLDSETNVEAADIFTVSNDNNFKVGSVIIDAILNGEL
ncbi:MAG: hypothetical protein Q4A66_07090 [Eubacteriales bacterium]|nr:hypothetical protein [Eubacteriales bacterium]